MSQEIEFEAKSSIRKESFFALMHEFNLTEADAIDQANYYFETPDFSVKNTGSALRIREKFEAYTLTLKQPHHHGILETHQELSEEQWQTALNTHKLPLGEVYDQLKLLHIQAEKLRYVGVLKTSRIEQSFNNGIICFDKSQYFDKLDYEIEFEGTDDEHAQTTLCNLFIKLNIIISPTTNKVARFFKRKLELEQINNENK